MTGFVLSLGSNQGDRRALLREAVARLRATSGVWVDRISSVYETDAWGKIDQPDFYNVVLTGSTELEPEALLDATQAIEQGLGRVRHERWGPRVIDIDIIVMDQIVRDDAQLCIPHPYATERAFVVVPWRELDPGALAGVEVDATSVRRLGPL